MGLPMTGVKVCDRNHRGRQRMASQGQSRGAGREPAGAPGSASGRETDQDVARGIEVAAQARRSPAARQPPVEDVCDR